MANEQLQFFFNEHIFRWEQEEYHREGIDWSDIGFDDNKPLLDFFFGKPIGFLSVLDEECHFPQSTDVSFAQKLRTNFTGHKFFQSSKDEKSMAFAVTHYAGKVEYSAEGFLEKNRDAIPPGLMQILQFSENKLVSQIFSATISRTGTLAVQGRFTVKGRKDTKAKRMSQQRQKFIANKKALTVGAQFKNSLSVLIERLNAAAPHFVRCIKPNREKMAEKFDDQYVKDQLKYTGVLETTRIRKEGYSVRLRFSEFVHRYKVISLDLGLPDTAQSCTWILHTANMKNWKIGHTKVFLKYWHLDQLTEYIRKMGVNAVSIQKVVRGFLDRRRVKKLKEITKAEVERISLFLAQLERRVSFTETKQVNLEKIPVNVLAPADAFESLKIDADLPPPPEDLLFDLDDNLPPLASPSDEKLQEEDKVNDEEMELEEDTFTKAPKFNQGQFGCVGTKKAAARWFQETQLPKGAVSEETGKPSEWFHGLIPRRESERLLASGALGCFLIRVSESRFGYSLSFKAPKRCKHYMIEQTRSGKYVIIGLPKAFENLHELVKYHKEVPIDDQGNLLTEPCGQEESINPDYEELYLTLKPRPTPTKPPRRSIEDLTPIDELPPPIPEKTYRK